MGKELKNLDLMTLVTLALALCISQQLVPGLPGGSVVKNPPANAGDAGLISALGRCPGEGNDNPLQYSCLGNPMDRGAWRSIQSMGWQKSKTRLKD